MPIAHPPSRLPLRLMAVLAMAALLPAIDGCEAPSESPGPCAATTGATLPGEPVWLWQGHDYRWRELSHRVAFLRTGLSAPDLDGSVQAELGLTGGDWSTGEAASDVPVYRVGWSRLRSESVSAVYGASSMTVGPSGVASTIAELHPASLELMKDTLLVVALRGVCFDADRPLAEGAPPPYRGSQGWTPSAIGAGVGEVSIDEASGQVRFDVSATFRAGGLDRADMNHAVPYAQVDAVVSWVVLAVRGGVVTSGTLGAAAEFETRGDSWTAIPPLLDDEPLELTGQPDLPLAAPLLRSWSFELNPDERWAGSYLRAWSARLGSFDYDPETGVGRVGLLAALSNSSLLQESDLEVLFQGGVDLLQVPDPVGDLVRAHADGEQDGPGPWSHPIDPSGVEPWS
jgi:hypothetical protein